MFKTMSLLSLICMTAACGPFSDPAEDEDASSESASPNEAAKVLAWSVPIALAGGEYSRKEATGSGTFEYADLGLLHVDGRMSGEWAADGDEEFDLVVNLDELGVGEERFTGPLSIFVGMEPATDDILIELYGDLETAWGAEIEVDLDTTLIVSEETLYVEYEGTIDGVPVSGYVRARDMERVPEGNEECRVPIGVDCG